VVKDFDKFSRHRSIGEALVSLEDLNLGKGVHIWRKLMPSERVSDP